MDQRSRCSHVHTWVGQRARWSTLRVFLGRDEALGGGGERGAGALSVCGVGALSSGPTGVAGRAPTSDNPYYR